MSGVDPVVVTPATLRAWALPRPGEGHEAAAGKEARGSVLVLGGSLETPGAALLAGLAALRAGASSMRWGLPVTRTSPAAPARRSSPPTPSR